MKAGKETLLPREQFHRRYAAAWCCVTEEPFEGNLKIQYPLKVPFRGNSKIESLVRD